jgi:hypothetical protein
MSAVPPAESSLDDPPLTIVRASAPDEAVRLHGSDGTAFVFVADLTTTSDLTTSDLTTARVEILAPLLVRRSRAVQIVDEIVHAADPRARLVLETDDPLVRHEARTLGFDGALRGALTRPPRDSYPAPTIRSDDVLAELAVLLPAVELEQRPTFGRALVFVARARSDDEQVRARIRAARGVMSEEVARSIDTVLRVRLWLGPVGSGLGRLSFDGWDFGGSRASRWAGLANAGPGAISINPDLAVADALAATRARRARDDPFTRAAIVPPPFTAIEGVTVHEMWHLVDAAVIGSGSRYVDFNRELGAVLGVATIEHALRGAEQGAPAEWRHAREALIMQVSAYAATNPRELNAEMFKVFWFAGAASPPLVARFAALVNERLHHG